MGRKRNVKWVKRVALVQTNLALTGKQAKAGKAEVVRLMVLYGTHPKFQGVVT